MSDANDLFGHPTGSGQLSLFGSGESRMTAPAPAPIDYPARARAKLRGVLELMRAAKTMPWSERDARMWQVVFPQMANWLPDDEANQLRFEFAQEIERLKAA
ncbi:MAG TPA: hypothetical protein VLI41_02465 [Phenylobacterium sp.]|uniref:hypothetical protein n=1 Tax=Phenylobacterium sp. TaxID=1871053 RepID=UPI002CD0D61F|nr:hypothetical protein [Phenylobacterium sp.]HSV02044.1 hypothetical protein [Phenylobacterium sp.]